MALGTVSHLGANIIPFVIKARNQYCSFFYTEHRINEVKAYRIKRPIEQS